MATRRPVNQKNSCRASLEDYCRRPNPPKKNDKAIRLPDEDFDKISKLIKQEVQNEDWSRRPRTYAVLMMIDRVPLMHSFVREGLYDACFPYPDRDSLPRVFATEPTSAIKFLEYQEHVYSNILELEKGIEGKHISLPRGDELFVKGPVLGYGSEGTRVDQVRSKQSNVCYARKRLPRTQPEFQNDTALEKFERELAALKKVSHVHLVQVRASYTDKRWVAILMDPIADCNLKEYLEEGIQEDQYSRFRGYFGCLTSAVSYLHGQKFRHKDIKPQNILIKKGDFPWEIYLSDFGTCLDWSESSHGTTVGTVTARTPRYQSPEVAKGDERQQASDVWSLGVVFLEMTTVLHGKTIADMDTYLGDVGTYMPMICNNIKGAVAWMNVLAQENFGDQSNDEPLNWTRAMLHETPRMRPKADEVFDTIKDAQDGTFCNRCCSGMRSPSSSPALDEHTFSDLPMRPAKPPMIARAVATDHTERSVDLAPHAAPQGLDSTRSTSRISMTNEGWSYSSFAVEEAHGRSASNPVAMLSRPFIPTQPNSSRRRETHSTLAGGRITSRPFPKRVSQSESDIPVLGDSRPPGPVTNNANFNELQRMVEKRDQLHPTLAQLVAEYFPSLGSRGDISFISQRNLHNLDKLYQMDPRGVNEKLSRMKEELEAQMSAG